MGVGLALLPFLLLVLYLRNRQGGWRGGILIAAVLWIGYLVCLTEVLSVLSALTESGLVCGWIIGSVLVIAAAGLKLIPVDESAVAAERSADRGWIWAIAAPIVVLALVLAWVAWMGPPNNSDSMTYHSPRVIHWIQNHNVAFYPAASLNQLEMAPGAEYIVLNFQLLSGGDRGSDFVQWSAYCGCIIGVSAIAGLLGAGGLGQILAAAVAASLPMACLQAVTTQNDLVTAFWMTCLAWLILRTIQISRGPWGRTAWLMTFLCGAALGLALLTKTPAYIFSAPLVLGLFAALLINRKWRAILPMALVAVTAMTMNLPAYARNMRFSHSPLGGGGFGPAGSAPYRNEHVGLGPTVINGLRNAGLQLDLPQWGIGGRVETVVRKACRLLGLDPDDPGTRFLGAPFRIGNVLWSCEDNAPDPLQWILMMAGAVVLWAQPRQPGWSGRLYVLAILLAFLGFCACLRWQPWHNRLLLPLMVLGSAYVGLAMERIMSRMLGLSTAWVLLAATAPFILLNYNHPLIGAGSIFRHDRNSRYFAGAEQYATIYKSIVANAAAHQCRQVGVIMDKADKEYPLMMLLRQRLPDVRIETLWPNVHIEDFADGPRWSAERLHTHNRGWDANLKPYMVVKIAGPNTVMMQSGVEASKLAFGQQPTQVQVMVPVSPVIRVYVEDSSGEIVGGNSSEVTLTVENGPGAASGTLTARAVNGVATFRKIMLNSTGLYTLRAAAGSLTAATSDRFTVSTTPGASFALTTPAARATVNVGGTFEIDWTGGARADTVQIWAQGGPDNTAIELAAGLPQSQGHFLWNTTGVAHGSYFFQAWDIPGNGDDPYAVVSPDSLHVVAPGVARPNAALLNPPPSTATVVQGSRYTLNWSATDGANDTNPIHLQLWVYSGDTGQWSILPGADFLPAPQSSYGWDTTGMLPGWYRFSMLATNGDVWTRRSSPGWLHITVGAPTITYGTPTSGQSAAVGESFNLRWSIWGLAADEVSQSTVQIWAQHLRDGSPVWEEIADGVNAGQGSFAWTVPSTPGAGTYYAFKIWLKCGDASWAQASPNWLHVK